MIVYREAAMIRDILKKISYQIVKRQIKQSDGEAKAGASEKANLPLSQKLNENIEKVKELTGNSSDIIIREFLFGNRKKINAALIYVDGLTNSNTINESIIRPLMYGADFINRPGKISADTIAEIKGEMLSVGEVQEINNMDELLKGCFSGDAALVMEGFGTGFILTCKGWEKRSVSEPDSEIVVRGPREGFTENLRTNTALIRRKIKTPDLTIETRILGKQTQTTVCLAYIKGIANEELITDPIRARLDKIDTDAILESGYIEAIY